MADASLTNEHAPTTKSQPIDIPSEQYDSMSLLQALPSPNTLLNFQGSDGQVFGPSLIDTDEIKVLNIVGHSVCIGTDERVSLTHQSAIMADNLNEGYVLLETDVTTWYDFLQIGTVTGERSNYPIASKTLRVGYVCTAVDVHTYSTTSPVLIAKIDLVGAVSTGYHIAHVKVGGRMTLSPIHISAECTSGVRLRYVHENVSLEVEMTKSRDARNTDFYDIENILPGVKMQVTFPHSDLYDNFSSGVRLHSSEPDSILTVKGMANVTAGDVIRVWGKTYFGRIHLESGGHQVMGSAVLLILGKNFKGTVDLTAEEKLEGDRLVQIGGAPNRRATLIVHRCEQVSEEVMDNFALVGALVKSATVGKCVKQAEPSKHSKAVEEEMAAEHQLKERDDRKEMFDEVNRIFEKLSTTEDEPSAMPSTFTSTIGAIGLAVGCALAVVGLCAMFVMKGVFAKRAEEKNTRDDEVSQL